MEDFLLVSFNMLIMIFGTIMVMEYPLNDFDAQRSTGLLLENGMIRYS